MAYMGYGGYNYYIPPTQQNYQIPQIQPQQQHQTQTATAPAPQQQTFQFNTVPGGTVYN